MQSFPCGILVGGSDPRHRPVARPDGPDTTAFDLAIERADDFAYRHAYVVAVQIVQIDALNSQAAQAFIQIRGDDLFGQVGVGALIIRAGVRVTAFCGNNHIVRAVQAP